jgi:hypothetical protein
MNWIILRFVRWSYIGRKYYQDKTRHGDNVLVQSGWNVEILLRTFTKFRFIMPSGFRGEDFRNRPIRNINCLWWPCLLTDRGEMSNLYRIPSIDASCQVWFIWSSGFRGGDFLKIDQTDTRIAHCGHICYQMGTKWAIFIEDLP